MYTTAKNYEIIHTDTRYCTLNLGYSFITLRELCNNQRPTEMCKKYSVIVIFYCIFYIKPQFFKTLFQSQFLFDKNDFGDIFTNRSENVCSFLRLF